MNNERDNAISIGCHRGGTDDIHSGLRYSLVDPRGWARGQRQERSKAIVLAAEMQNTTDGQPTEQAIKRNPAQPDQAVNHLAGLFLLLVVVIVHINLYPYRGNPHTCLRHLPGNIVQHNQDHQ